METIRVLVNAPGTAVFRYLRDNLPAHKFDVVETQPGRDFERAVARHCPEIAVIGRVGERAYDALQEVLTVQAVRPGAVVVAVNTVPTTPEAAEVGRLARYFVDGSRLGRPIGPELLHLILASADDGALRESGIEARGAGAHAA